MISKFFIVKHGELNHFYQTFIGVFYVFVLAFLFLFPFKNSEILLDSFVTRVPNIRAEKKCRNPGPRHGNIQ